MNIAHHNLRGAWLIVGLLWFVAVLNYLDRSMITTMRGSLVAAIPMTDAQFGLLTSVFLWVYGVISPLAGFLADRFSKSRIIICSVLVWSAVTWLTGEAKTYHQLLLARGLMGVSEACYIPAALSLITDYHRRSTQSLATGIHMTGLFVGAGLGGIGGWLANYFEWNFAFHLFGGIGVVYAVMLGFFLRDARPNPAEIAGQSQVSKPRFSVALTSLLTSQTFLLLLAFWGLLGISGWVVNHWMPTYLGEHFHLDQSTAGFAATGYTQAAALAGVLIGGFWADRWIVRNWRGRIFVCLIGLCAAAPGIFLVATSNLLFVALLGLILFGLGRAFTDANMMPILCQFAESRFRATGYGILNLCACAAGGIATYAAGGLRDAQINLSVVFMGAAVSLLVCSGLLLLVSRTATSVQEQSIQPLPGVSEPVLQTETV